MPLTHGRTCKEDSRLENNVVLSVKNLSVNFKVRGRELKAIRNVTLDLKDQETLAIVGESGSGKSVLTKTFTGMLEANGYIADGTIQYGDVVLSDLKKDKDWDGIRGKEITTIFQDPMTSLDPIKTIGSQISEVIVKHQGKSAKEAKALAIDLMTRTGIPDAANRYNEYPFEYSGGMRQRIVIAVALACHPKILICDEPTTALDVTIQAQILALIQSLQKEYHFTTIFITHDLGVVASIADRIAVMYAGQIVEMGTCDEIFYDPRHPYTWSLLSSLPQLATQEAGLYSIPGTPPSLYNDITGDAFAPRNSFAMAIDFKREPPEFAVTVTHWAKTWLLDPRAPKVEKPKIIQNLHERLVKLSQTATDAETGGDAIGNN
ncbi:ABC transporter ATP-binding protein [Lactiplantibacillus pentosus]|nr:ABC transporter ATP-binding protein [Lactiplantibacillus pentosus]